MKDDSSEDIRRGLPVASFAGFMIVIASFTHLSITLINQRFSNYSPIATMNLVFVKLLSDSYYGNRVF